MGAGAKLTTICKIEWRKTNFRFEQTNFIAVFSRVVKHLK